MPMSIGALWARGVHVEQSAGGVMFGVEPGAFPPKRVPTSHLCRSCSMQYPAVTESPLSDNRTIVSHVARIVTGRNAAHEPQPDHPLEENRLR